MNDRPILLPLGATLPGPFPDVVYVATKLPDGTVCLKREPPIGKPQKV